jgi:dihydroflavonol-4-reductase
MTFHVIAAIPRLSFGIVDVRDVALAHVLAMEKPEVSDGQRYILYADWMWAKDIARVLKQCVAVQGESVYLI